MKIESKHVVIDVTKGRKKIEEHVRNGGTVFVVIHGTIQGDFSLGNDDGVSQEFTLVPTLVAAARPVLTQKAVRTVFMDADGNVTGEVLSK